MKNAVLAVSFLTALASGTAAAHADHYSLGSRDWSGVYIAGSVGYGIADAEDEITLDGSTFSGVISSHPDADGVTGTVAIGYDRQLDSHFVAGVFADYTFGELDGSGTRVYPNGDAFRFNLEYDNAWAIGARLGYTRSEHTLWYVTAGYTEADLSYSDQFGSVDKDLQGFFLGAGVEHNIRDNFFLKLEYRYSNYGDETIFEDTATSGPCGTECYEREDIDTDIHSIRLGIAYKFGGPAPAAPAPLK